MGTALAVRHLFLSALPRGAIYKANWQSQTRRCLIWRPGLRHSDEKYFAPLFSRHRQLTVWNARERASSLEDAHGLLLTGGRDIAPEFLRQPVPNPSPIEKETDPRRDEWEFDAIARAVPRGLPIFAICKGMQTLNVALGGAIAVYNPDDPERAAFRKCYQLSAHADRVRHIAPADYRPNTHLRMLLEQMVEETADRMVEQRKTVMETGTVRPPKH